MATRARARVEWSTEPDLAPSPGNSSAATSHHDVVGNDMPAARSRTPPDHRGGRNPATRAIPLRANNNEIPETPAAPPAGRFRLWPRHRRPVVIHLAVFALSTGWWVGGLVLHRHDKNWIVPFLLWLAVALRLVFCHVPASRVADAVRLVWRHTALRVHGVVPARLRTPAGALCVAAVILVGGFATPESADNTRENRAVSIFGLAVFVFLLWLTSRDRRGVDWRPVIVGFLAQYLIALFVLRTRVGYDVFRFVADRARDLLGFAGDGVAFLTTPEVASLPWFLLGVVPAIMFFVSLVQVLYHVGFLQWLVGKLAVFVFWALACSGVEAVTAVATPLLGQGESAMLVRPFVPYATRSELHCILTAGFATISGSVLAGYIRLGLNAEVLVSSCVMSVPASLAVSKLRYPETEETLTAGRVVMPGEGTEKAPANALHAFAEGAWFGIRVAGSIVSCLLCTIALVGLVNGLLAWCGRYLDISDPDLSLQLVLSYVCYPVAFLLGVPRTGDLYKVASLIAEKIVTNEYNAFMALTTDEWYADLSPRSALIATYALAGFGNFASLGVQIGILSQIAPTRAGDVAGVALSALISGIVATLTTATVAGLVITDQTTILRG